MYTFVFGQAKNGWSPRVRVKDIDRPCDSYLTTLVFQDFIDASSVSALVTMQVSVLSRTALIAKDSFPGGCMWTYYTWASNSHVMILAPNRSYTCTTPCIFTLGMTTVQFRFHPCIIIQSYRLFKNQLIHLKHICFNFIFTFRYLYRKLYDCNKLSFFFQHREA